MPTATSTWERSVPRGSETEEAPMYSGTATSTRDTGATTPSRAWEPSAGDSGMSTRGSGREDCPMGSELRPCMTEVWSEGECSLQRRLW